MIQHAIRFAIVFAALLAWGHAPRCCGADREATSRESSHRGQFQLLSAVSDQFLHETETATSSIPDNVWQAVQRAGWRVQWAEFVVDAVPSLKGVHPRGWPEDTTWENTDALHLPKSKLLVVAEKRRTRAGQVVASTRVAGVLRHELGHAFDMACGGSEGFRSASPEFVTVYQRDVANLPADHPQQLEYYLQASAAGAQETFAEAFAVVLGGGSSHWRVQRFEQAFPSVVVFLQQTIRSYQPESDQLQRRSVLPRRIFKGR